ncbi:hypothetical protein ABT56_08035 [Photobacterium aquae]|uniref:Uncharacterized protein n=1 Tax=Photobacterium aquae TaxID=1195763 RepID=A0A0J1H470_9GAMM|nr:hypothetical protein ABT56_08035 [Photobacterium aquae]
MNRAAFTAALCYSLYGHRDKRVHTAGALCKELRAAMVLGEQPDISIIDAKRQGRIPRLLIAMHES